MPKYYPERPTANAWQFLGDTLGQAGNVVHGLDVNLQEQEQKSNLLQDMVERRIQRQNEEARQQKELALKEAEAQRKDKDEDRKFKVQEKLVTAITKGVPAGEYDQNLVDGVPDPLLGLRPNAPQKQALRPADENDVTGIAAEGMDPYQTAALYNKPAAAAASHGYKMDEIGARGENSRSVAQIRAAAMERATRIRASYGSRGGKSAPKDWTKTMEDASTELTDIERELAELEASKPKRSWDLQPWNTEMSRLVGQKKFYQALVYKANQNGVAMPADEYEEPHLPEEPDPPAATQGKPPAVGAPPRAQGKPKVLDRNTAAKYMTAAKGDKAEARRMAAADGWKF